MKALLNNTAFLSLTFLVMSAHGQQQSSMELTCRTKAKEIAAQTYSSCVTESRNAQIDQIRKDYQKQLTDLKAKYDNELKKVGGKSAVSAAPTGKNSKKPATPVANSVATGAAPKPTKGVPKTLPSREEMKPATSETSESESTAIQNDADGDMKIELVPASDSTDNNTASTVDSSY